MADHPAPENRSIPNPFERPGHAPVRTTLFNLNPTLYGTNALYAGIGKHRDDPDHCLFVFLRDHVFCLLAYNVLNHNISLSLLTLYSGPEKPEFLCAFPARPGGPGRPHICKKKYFFIWKIVLFL
jgi:hypothetical protein